jgi:hypothetical protein
MNVREDGRRVNEREVGGDAHADIDETAEEYARGNDAAPLAGFAAGALRELRVKD